MPKESIVALQALLCSGELKGIEKNIADPLLQDLKNALAQISQQMGKSVHGRN